MRPLLILSLHICYQCYSFQLSNPLRKNIIQHYDIRSTPDIRMLIDYQQSFWQTSEGLNLEIISSSAKEIVSNTKVDGQSWYSRPYNQMMDSFNQNKKPLIYSKPPLLFIHGSYHSAWCWAENFFEVSRITRS